jgi:hypothetical protein
MRGKLVVAVLAGALAGGMGTALVVRQPEARAQEKDRAPERRGGWEYQVVFASSQGKDVAKAMTEQFAALAKDGWEYVGPVVDYTRLESAPQAAVGVGGAYVLFRRPKP